MSRIPRQRLNAFLDMLAAERGAARNTLDAYERDISDYLVFLGGKPLEGVSADEIRGIAVFPLQGVAEGSIPPHERGFFPHETPPFVEIAAY